MQFKTARPLALVCLLVFIFGAKFTGLAEQTNVLSDEELNALYGPKLEKFRDEKDFRSIDDLIKTNHLRYLLTNATFQLWLAIESTTNREEFVKNDLDAKLAAVNYNDPESVANLADLGNTYGGEIQNRIRQQLKSSGTPGEAGDAGISTFFEELRTTNDPAQIVKSVKNASVLLNRNKNLSADEIYNLATFLELKSNPQPSSPQAFDPGRAWAEAGLAVLDYSTGPGYELYRPRVLLKQSQLLYRLSRYSDALGLLGEAKQLYPDYCGQEKDYFNFLLGRTLMATGNSTNALEIFATLSNGPYASPAKMMADAIKQDEIQKGKLSKLRTQRAGLPGAAAHARVVFWFLTANLFLVPTLYFLVLKKKNAN